MTARLNVPVDTTTVRNLYELRDDEGVSITEIVRRSVSVYEMIGPELTKPGVQIRLVKTYDNGYVATQELTLEDIIGTPNF